MYMIHMSTQPDTHVTVDYITVFTSNIYSLRISQWARAIQSVVAATYEQTNNNLDLDLFKCAT